MGTRCSGDRMKLHVEFRRLRQVLDVRWAERAGTVTGTRDQLAALLPVRERVLGPDHPVVLTMGYNFAYSTGKEGDAAGARDQLAALVPVRERVSGPEHPDTLTARNNLAVWTRRPTIRPAHATSWPRCCRCASACSARSTRTPRRSEATSHAGAGRRANDATQLSRREDSYCMPSHLTRVPAT